MMHRAPRPGVGPTFIFLLLLTLVTDALCQDFNETLKNLSEWMEIGDTEFIDGSAFTLVAIEPLANNFTAANNNTKRLDCEPVVYHWTQAQVVQSGTWWSQWSKVSDCLYCGLSDQECTEGMGWSSSRSASYSAGFDLSLSGTVLKLINSNAQFNFGYQWTASWSDSGSYTCTAQPGSVVSVWEQKLMGWSNSQTRAVSVSESCFGDHYEYGAWSAYQHANWVIDGSTSQNWGCSTGDSSHCPQ